MKKKGLAVVLATLMAVSALTACADSSGSVPVTQTQTTTTQTQEETQTTEGTQTAAAEKEAPMLAEQVAAGTLPAVEERLPKEGEAMLEEMDSIGTYGGSFKFAYTKAGWNTGKPIEEGLFRFKNDGTVEPNVAKGYEVNEDATVYTIHLREGMKWSDGVDFTADDCIFFYDHMCVPETFGKSLWDCFKVSNPEDADDVTTAKFEKIDDYTFTVSFEYPKANFIENLAINGKWCFAPKHYHETILPEFIGEEAAQKKAEEMGFSDVVAMGKETGYYFWNVPGIPTLNSYILTDEAGKNDVNGDYYEFVRNPYYWKVDAEGKQLPYVDKIETTRISDDSQGLLLTLQGDITIGTVGWADIATVQENAEKGHYYTTQWDSCAWASTETQVQLNLTVQDDNLKTLFNNIKFREALSVCVDREEYAKILSDGWCIGKQASPVAGLLGASEDWDKQWTEYDVERAKSLLEECGLVMGNDGYYDFADGTDFVLNLSTFTDCNADASAELLMKYYGDAGIKTTYKPVDRDLLNNMTTSNEFDVIVGPVAPAESISIILRPDTIVPVRNYAAWYSQVGNWYATRGAEGVEPEGDLKTLCELYDQLRSTVDAAEQTKIAEEMMALHQKNQWIIGYMEAAPVIYVVDQNLKNFPENRVFSDEFRGIGIAHIHCCYFAE